MLKIKKSCLTSAIFASCGLLFSAHSFASEFVVTDADFHQRNTAKEELGKFLMFDKIMSGNKNTSCATCHHPLAGLGDGLSLPIGEGGSGLGVTRNTGSGADAVVERVPRNAPHVFNLGAKEFTVLFHDGRVSVDNTQPSGFATPAGDDFPAGLDNALAAQAMFPITSPAEMAGQAGESAVGDAAAAGRLAGEGGLWDLLAARLRANTEYVELFKNAYDDVNSAEDITIVHAANAIGAFEAADWRCTDSPFDRYWKEIDAGVDPFETTSASFDAINGGVLFYGKAGCSTCHSGPMLTDHQFHSVAMPQIGPGRGDNQDGHSDNHDDFGREQVTGNPSDRFKFRTPSLRQVAQTGPWGHDGAYNTLEAIVRHMADPVTSLANYDTTQAVLPSRSDLDELDFIVQNDTNRRQAISDANEVVPVTLSDDEVRLLVSFLNALTDPSCIDLRRTVPSRVPSGLTLAE